MRRVAAAAAAFPKHSPPFANLGRVDLNQANLRAVREVDRVPSTTRAMT